MKKGIMMRVVMMVVISGVVAEAVNKPVTVLETVTTLEYPGMSQIFYRATINSGVLEQSGESGGICGFVPFSGGKKGTDVDPTGCNNGCPTPDCSWYNVYGGVNCQTIPDAVLLWTTGV